jgi:predicted methyltransferase
MSASLAASLKPGGRLAIVDFTPPGAEATMPADRDQDAMHGVTPDSVRRELADAGFIAEKTETGSGRWFMVVAVRPGS